MSRIYIIYLLLTFSLAPLSAQKRSAQKFYNEAQTQIDTQNAISLLKKAIARDSTYAEAYLDLSRRYAHLQYYNQQIDVLSTASRKCQRKTTFIFAQLSRAAYLNGDYQIAINAISQIENRYDAELKRLKENINFALEAVSHPVAFDAINLGENVNTPYHDYWPSLSIDEQEIVTTVFINDNNDSLNIAQEDFFYSKKTEQEWSKAKPLSKLINSPLNEGAQCLSADGKIMLFTACNRFDCTGACDIYIAYKKNGVWSPPTPLPSPVNTEFWEGHPCLSANGKELYFSSNREGGYGGRDLYVAFVNLTPPISIDSVRNLDNTINTDKDEISPFIHPDGKTLYFSSDGHIGLGRQDIYYTHKDSNGVFSLPVNFGYPINTHQDEIGLVVNARGTRGYFSAEKEDSRKKDIYTFRIPSRVQPEEATFFKANITDKSSKKALKAEVEVRLTTSGELVYKADSTNEFTIPLPFGNNYAINVSHPGCLFYSENIDLTKNTKTPFEKNILLSPIKQGEKITLRNILFEKDSYNLDTCFMSELKKAIELIEMNKEFNFEILGFTDSIGSIEYNQKLSEKRAKTVYDYFIAQGIAKNRLSYKGYGETHPVSTENDKNRRTELLVK